MGDHNGDDMRTPRADLTGAGRCSTDAEVSRTVLVESRASQYTGGSKAPTLSASLRKLESFARTNYPILLEGETGTGKTLLARTIHEWSGRSGTFHSVSLGGIPEELCYAMLCGSRRGSFTGSVEDQQGYVAAATRGTLFLDELGLATTRTQHCLLTILETRAIPRIGETRAMPVDTRFIFATSRNLSHLVHEGHLLIDLYYRVSELTFSLPALRQQRDIIVPTADRMIEATLRDLNRPYSFTISDELQHIMTNAPWFGNFRELRSLCTNLALSLDCSRELVLADVPAERLSKLCVVGPTDRSPDSERSHIMDALIRTGGNKAKAARELGMSRGALYRALERSD